MAPIGTELDDLILRTIQAAYLAGKIRKTKDCMEDMARARLFEADVEKVVMDACTIEKAIPATSERASNPNNTHYVIRGTSINGVEVYCKICSNYHPQTNEFIGWKLTSFENKSRGKK
jgi:tryptophan synthase beta subunit